MATKRSRLSQASSSAVLDDIRPLRSAAVKLAKSSEEDRAWASVVDVPASSEKGVAIEGQIGNFLEKCYLCQKKIAESDAVFMYSSCAFCTPECRDTQIKKDKLAEAFQRSNQARNVCDARKNMENPVVTQPGKSTTPQFKI